MIQKRFVKLGFSLALVAVLCAGGMALLSEPASAGSSCPGYICANTNGWTHAGSCLYFEKSTGCLFSCTKYTYTSGSGVTSTCRTNCIPL